jgi:hypothetical protein
MSLKGEQGDDPWVPRLSRWLSLAGVLGVIRGVTGIWREKGGEWRASGGEWEGVGIVDFPSAALEVGVG